MSPWGQSRYAQNKQMLSALPSLATGERTFRIGSFVPQAVIAQMRCPSLRFEPRAKKSCRPLLEQFRPRVRNEAIAVWHLHARKRLRVENHCFVDNIAFRKDESYHRINLIGV